MRQKWPRVTRKILKPRINSRFLCFLCSPWFGLPYSLSWSSLPSFFPLFILVRSQLVSISPNQCLQTDYPLVCTRYCFYYLAVLQEIQGKRMTWSPPSSFIYPRTILCSILKGWEVIKTHRDILDWDNRTWISHFRPDFNNNWVHIIRKFV